MVCTIRPSLSFPKIGFSFLGKNVKADNTTTPEFKCVVQLLEDATAADNANHTRMAAACTGVSEETTTGVRRLKETAAVDDGGSDALLIHKSGAFATQR
mgnify:CR=1 FL=1